MIMKRSGYAAEKINKKLEKIGSHIIEKPIGFYVKDFEGPLIEGEKEKAQRWLSSLF